MKKNKFTIGIIVLIAVIVLALYYGTGTNKKLSKEYKEAEQKAEELNNQDPYEGSIGEYKGPNDIDAAIEGNADFFLAPIE